MDQLQQYMAVSKYAKWISKTKGRENWAGTTERYTDFVGDLDLLTEQELADVHDNILNLDVMPSMRALMTAGKALHRCNTVGYNCCASAVDHPRVFDEIFYLLMGGSGIGWSVERQFINKLPEIAESFHDTETTIIVQDSRAGWAKALKELIAMLFNGDIPKWDVSRVRPAGKRLKTMGGRSSGPDPLVKLFKQCIKTFTGAKGRKLNSIECHDLICTICYSVIVGGVRRAAGISFSNLTDDRMRRAKDGQWWNEEPNRALANNSVMYTEKPDIAAYTKEWRTLLKSKSGERGMVNQVALLKKVIECTKDPDNNHYYLLNPCGEAILRSDGGFCNLSSVPIRPQNKYDDVKEKIRIAVIIGTVQSTLTNFKYLRKIWTTNAEEERLLGVSLTGIMDHIVFSNRATTEEFMTFSNGQYDNLDDILASLRVYAREVNVEYAERFGINPARQVSLIKPEGSTSLLCSTSSGIHPRYSRYYIRRVRQDIKDPLTQLMIDQGVPYVIDVDKVIFSFYVKSPEHSVLQEDLGAIQQLELWKIYAKNWCDGNPSQTIYYTDDDFLDVSAWVWKNWDSVGGLSFFPHTDAIYENAPLEMCTEEEYNSYIKDFPEIDFSKLVDYEKEDTTNNNEAGVACSGGACDMAMD